MTTELIGVILDNANQLFRKRMKPQNSVEAVNIDQALENFGGNRFELILGASQRAREIANRRVFAERGGDRTKYNHRPIVQSLIDVAEGRAGREYLDKLK